MIASIHSIRLVKGFAILALMAALVACGGKAGGKKESVHLKDAPSKVAAVYQSRCLNCHGNDLQGRVGANTNLQQVGSRMSFEEIAAQIEQGKGLMPGFADSLSQNEIDGLSEWLATKQ
ncbi:c-type cytochrome [Paenibacillus paeoniae]|uniref:c-type cytochrome n=1 Tax=Paenibacillus paeoniae TaxID=2292705 RepID=UPI001F0C4F91|nr:cytochrome c [Paenibacillus paeoniae]